VFAIILLGESKGVSMARNLQIRNVEDELIVRLKLRALRHVRSAEAEHREIRRQVLSEEPGASFDELAAELRAMTARRRQTPSELLLREGREERCGRLSSPSTD
jgi:plasmid stability protein